MSKPYPSRRELRLQREREQRAQVRDEEVHRWAQEFVERKRRAAQQAEQIDAPQTATPEQDTTVTTGPPTGRRASVSPVDAEPESTTAQQQAPGSRRRRRRADSEVTSTGMIPIITKPQAEETKPRPRTRREMRELEAKKQAALNQTEQPEKPTRRANAPQTTPPPIPAETQFPAVTPESPEVAVGENYQESAVEITDMSGLDTIEIRRAELRAETEKLTQQILELGQQNPNVIDPVMLRRQKELAAKSQELQELETAAISIVEESVKEDTTEQTTTDHKSDLISPQEIEEETETGRDVTTGELPSRRSQRQEDTGPMITGPFDVPDVPTPQDSADPLTETPEKTVVSTTQSSGDPVDASEAHGLDSIDAKEFEAPERRMMLSSIAIFAIGIIALIIAIILLTR